MNNKCKYEVGLYVFVYKFFEIRKLKISGMCFSKCLIIFCILVFKKEKYLI